jgi:hypothetical protein
MRPPRIGSCAMFDRALAQTLPTSRNCASNNTPAGAGGIETDPFCRHILPLGRMRLLRKWHYRFRWIVIAKVEVL